MAACAVSRASYFSGWLALSRLTWPPSLAVCIGDSDGTHGADVGSWWVAMALPLKCSQGHATSADERIAETPTPSDQTVVRVEILASPWPALQPTRRATMYTCAVLWLSTDVNCQYQAWSSEQWNSWTTDHLTGPFELLDTDHLTGSWPSSLQILPAISFLSPNVHIIYESCNADRVKGYWITTVNNSFPKLKPFLKWRYYIMGPIQMHPPAQMAQNSPLPVRKEFQSSSSIYKKKQRSISAIHWKRRKNCVAYHWHLRGCILVTIPQALPEIISCYLLLHCVHALLPCCFRVKSPYRAK